METKIKIKYGKLIEPFFKKFIESKYPDFVFPDESLVIEKTQIFTNEWKKYEEKFFFGLKNIGLEYKRNLIEVFIISATDRDMSSPLIIRSRYNAEEFISVLIHELLHVLFSDNKIKQEYTEETQGTRNHIYVFAILTYLLKDIFGEEDRLKTEKEKSSPEKNVEYYKAWKIVEKEGYKNIIKKMKTVS